MTNLPERIPVSIISGYLGAGKTTFINTLLKNADGRIYNILVNDFGEINIDASLIQNQTGDTINLSNGCACCMIGDNLALALEKQCAADNNPDALLIETSGIAKPDRIADICRVFSRLDQEQIIVITDAGSVKKKASDKYVGSTVQHQIRTADTILVNRLETIAPSITTNLINWLSSKAEDANILTDWDPSQILRDGKKPTKQPKTEEQNPRNSQAQPHAEQNIFSSYTWRSKTGLNVRELVRLISLPQPDIFRIKGMVTDEKSHEKHILHFDGHTASLTSGQASDTENQLVIIGKKGRIEGSDIVNFLKLLP